MDTKTRIIEESAHLFRTYGIRAVTMDMLAAHMGISKRTIYEVFRDKEELLQGVMRWMVLKQAELVKASLDSSSDVMEAIFKIMDTMMEHYRKMSPAFRLDMKKYHSDFMRIRTEEVMTNSLSKEILEKGIKQGIFRADIDIDITDKCLKGVTRMNDKEVPDDFESEDVIRNFFVNYLRGISTQKGLELIRINENKRMGNIRNLQI